MSKFEYIRGVVFVGLVLGVYVAEARILLTSAYHRLRGRDGDSGLWHPASIGVHVLAVVGLGCMAYGYFVEPYWLEVSRLKVRTKKLSDTRFRIVHISDLHCDFTPRNEKKLAELINPLNPDVIVFTGDAANSREAVPLFRRTLRSLRADLGKFAVRGNFDVGKARGWNLFKDTGFRVLRADVVTVDKGGEQLEICGMGQSPASPVQPSEKGTGDDDYTVYLHHYPALVEEIRDPAVELYLCGHTHGGQVALPWYGAIITLSETGKKYEAGRYEVGPTTMYVNRGIGMEGGIAPRVRFWSRPEVVVIDVVPDSS